MTILSDAQNTAIKKGLVPLLKEHGILVIPFLWVFYQAYQDDLRWVQVQKDSQIRWSEMQHIQQQQWSEALLTIKKCCETSNGK
jgi:hypothetical protein